MCPSISPHQTLLNVSPSWVEEISRHARASPAELIPLTPFTSASRYSSAAREDTVPLSWNLLANTDTCSIPVLHLYTLRACANFELAHALKVGVRECALYIESTYMVHHPHRAPHEDDSPKFWLLFFLSLVIVLVLFRAFGAAVEGTGRPSGGAKVGGRKRERRKSHETEAVVEK